MATLKILVVIAGLVALASTSVWAAFEMLLTLKSIRKLSSTYDKFELVSDFEPQGDQPRANGELTDGMV